jgi:hypothetical protein
VDAAGRSIDSFDYKESFAIAIDYTVSQPIRGLRLGFIVTDADGTQVFGTSDYSEYTPRVRMPGSYEERCQVPSPLLNSGTYYVTIGADTVPEHRRLLFIDSCIRFDVRDTEGHGPSGERPPGAVRPTLQWQFYGAF